MGGGCVAFEEALHDEQEALLEEALEEELPRNLADTALELPPAQQITTTMGRSALQHRRSAQNRRPPQGGRSHKGHVGPHRAVSLAPVL